MKISGEKFYEREKKVDTGEWKRKLFNQTIFRRESGCKGDVEGKNLGLWVI